MRLFRKNIKEKKIESVPEKMKLEVKEPEAEIKEQIKPLSLTDIIIKEKKVENNNNTVMREYYLCKILSRIIMENADFEAEVKNLNDSLKRLDDSIIEVKQLIDTTASDNLEEMITLTVKTQQLNNLQESLINRFKEINNIYSKMKLSTIGAYYNKNNRQLENFYDSINTYLMKYKNYKIAAQDIFYKSGDFLVELVYLIVNQIKKSDNEAYREKYNYHFFLQSDVIITISYEEWATLFNKIKCVSRFLKEDEMDNYLRVKGKYDRLEVIYTILMVYSEMEKN
ncbi:MAG: hypothetical protein WCS56_02205 [Bacilli bacterium]